MVVLCSVAGSSTGSVPSLGGLSALASAGFPCSSAGGSDGSSG
ncbi:hypothetical protein COLO4_16265 [Corchorus olitorius]|uniref:Uncharacterized protein n=1 Tax=Corchorus olitorius TaxID=93759 RepID=A0A1R3JIB3_9ROSI|nr:hypothetical protein COLO4_16265 [Corchorus olitorius]